MSSGVHRLDAVLRRSGELAALLASAGHRAEQAKAEAPARAAGDEEAFWFFCTGTLGDLAVASARQARTFAVLAGLRGEREDGIPWLRRAEQEAARAAEAGREIEKLAMRASLLALEVHLRADAGEQMAADVAEAAGLLREAGRLAPVMAADTIWAAADAARDMAAGRVPAAARPGGAGDE